MSESGVMQIYMSHSLKALMEQADKKIAPRSVEGLIKLMTELQKRVTSFREKRDQEMEYIFIFRYLSASKMLPDLPEFKNKDTLSKACKFKIDEACKRSRKYLDRFEILSDILDRRYKEMSAKSAKRHEETVDTILSIAQTPKQHVSDSEPVNQSSISTQSLYNIFKSTKAVNIQDRTSDSSKNLLIIDVRPKKDYENSRLIFNTISIPDEVIVAGTSAVKMGLSLDHEAASQWCCREEFEKIILMDWCSRSATLDPNSKIAILRYIMTNWDPLTKYKSPILILEGGYEDMILRYPQVSTNPKVDIPSETSNKHNLDLPVLDYPMSYVEEEKPPPPKEPPKPIVNSNVSLPTSNGSESVSTARPLAVNRSLKPKTYSHTKQFMKKMTQNDSEGEGDVPSKSFESNEVVEISSADDVLDDSVPVVVSSETDGDSETTKLAEELKKEVEELRKFKPVTGNEMEIVADTSIEDALEENRIVDEDGDDEIVHNALKGDGSSSTNLRRSYSSPNVAQVEDFELGSKPFFSRANKPFEEKIPFTSHIMGERMDSTYGKTALGLTGLKNVANNCYMNSIIQCLSNTEDLLNELVRLEKHPALNASSPTRGRVATEVITTFRSLWSGDVKCHSLRELKSLMGCYQEIYKGANHQDSHEFLIILLEYLHNDLNIPAEVTTLAGANEESGEKAWGEFRRKNCSPIQRLFCGQERSTVLCATCHHSSVTFGQFFQLAVPIPNTGRPPTLDSCIRLYLAGERVSGWQCPNCKAPRDAFKKIDITRLPPVLIIALKRFSQEGGSWLEKRESLVTYPLEGLHMKEHTVPGSEQRYDTYDLHALSTHTGSLRAGHYRAIAKNHRNNKWYMFDDSAVYPMSPQEVSNISEVYIMFYHAVK